ncbi:MAG: MOSC domain-containing protein [Lachnospiraceae bacterium]|nr:MOSC domain-containing protein [Lachnospiraceae bacterium]
MGTVHAICISEKKGTQKYEIPEVTVLEDFGLERDAHAGKWHRQVSLLSLERIEEFRAKGANISFGAFGENLVVSGFDFKSFQIGTKFKCNDVVLELTQIGKECHHGCQIRRQMGDCIMPREGVFCRVLKGGVIKKGDKFSIISEEK